MTVTNELNCSKNMNKRLSTYLCGIFIRAHGILEQVDYQVLLVLDFGISKNPFTGGRNWVEQRITSARLAVLATNKVYDS